MADEHTRKYNDWNIVKPQRSPKKRARVDAGDTLDIEDTSTIFNQQDLSTEDTSFATNPFIAHEDTSANNQEGRYISSQTPQATAPASFINDKQVAQDYDNQMNIDPDTGLPVPDYLKPYTKKDTNSST
ncbi:MAG: hypothetical protein ACKKL4_00805 [Patescibacteria group bacterium]